MSRRTYGVHMAMTLATERQMFQRDGRLPSQTGYSIHSDILRGTENSIEFNDYLSGKYVWVVYRQLEVCIPYILLFYTHHIYILTYVYPIYTIYIDPNMKPETPKIALHEVMEAKYGIM